jgi:plasmid rolling circle replication initiator protein Rep
MKNPKMSLLSAMKNQYDCVIHILETRPYNKYQIQNKYDSTQICLCIIKILYPVISKRA